MSLPKLLTAAMGTALCVSLIAGTSGALAGDHGNASASGRPWLSIGEISQRLEAAGYRNIEKIEREHGVYEARATDRQGLRTRLTINPQTGAIRERDGDRREREDAALSSRSEGGNPANCNKRRCRDDLPVPTASGPGPR